MKLVVPPLVVKDEDAFQNDIFGREQYGKALLNLVVRSDDALVISLDGKWGEGKTTFVKMWQGLLSEEGVPNLYIDAFENDYVDDAFIAVVSAVTDYAEKNILEEHRDELGAWKDKSIEVGKRAISWTARVAAKTATMGIIKDSDIEELKDIKGDLSKGASNLVGDFVKEQISSHSSNVESIQSFREALSGLPPKLGNSGKPFVIIVDELDRCRPTFAVEMIEKIKHLFSVERVVFVLVMNKDQLAESVKCVYGRNIDAHTYLQKFISLETRLPKFSSDLRTSDIYKYTLKLYKMHELETWEDAQNIVDCVSSFSLYLNLSLRQLEKVFSGLAVFYSVVSENSLRLVPVVVFLATVRVVDSGLYRRLSESKSSFEEVSEFLSLRNIKGSAGHRLNGMVEWLKYALLDNNQLSEISDEDLRGYARTLIRYNISREEIVPHFARLLNMFSVR